MVVTSPPYFSLRDYGVAGQIGLEQTPEAFVDELVDVFREVHRVLRDDGTLWLNLGDTYAANRSYQVSQSKHQTHDYGTSNATRIPPGLKPKDLIGIPWRTAFALQADGWFLRQDVIWSKPAPMPESVTDRCTKAHEYLFMLTKRERYYCDMVAIQEPAIGGAPGNITHKGKTAYEAGDERMRTKAGLTECTAREMRNKRSVWEVPTQPYPEAHFATFPPGLVEPCILAGTSPQVCEHCGAPWERVIEKETRFDSASARAGRSVEDLNSTGKWLCSPGNYGTNLKLGPVVSTVTMGWTPTCECENAGTDRAVVLDPFGGAGTTGLVADRLQRDSILVELNPDYVDIARRRIHGDAPLFAEIRAA